MEHILYIKPTGRFGNKGERYDIEYKGEIISSGHAPEFDAVRKLKEINLTGTAVFCRGDMACLKVPLDWGAKQTVIESFRTGPRIGKWYPNDWVKKLSGEK
jgi:hypothetical protein